MNSRRASGTKSGGRSPGSRAGALCLLTLISLASCRSNGPVVDAPQALSPKDQSKGAGSTSAVTAPRKTPPTRTIQPTRKTPPTETPPPDLFRRGRRVKFEAGSTLVQTVPVRFSRAALQSQKLHLPSFSEGRAPWLAVDHHAPRRARSAYFTLSELVNEDVELSPGSHFLTAFHFGPGEIEPLQLAAFSLDVGSASAPGTPGCVLFTPELTKNGKQAAKEIRFLAIPLAAGLDKLQYRADAPGFHSQGDAPPGTEMILENPPSGDIELSVRCLSSGEELARDEQIVTVNPEALEKEQP